MVDKVTEKGRRLAVIDTTFPWKLSGFRYWENYEIYQQRPDTLFFSTNLYKDEFPTPVYHFSQFTEIAFEKGITDIYCVFLNLTLSLLGFPHLVPGSNPLLNIRNFLEKYNIKVHTTLYPGGGLSPWTPKEPILVAVDRCKTIFTNIKEVKNIASESIYIPGIINTKYYCYKPKDIKLPIEIVFCATNAERKGFDKLTKVVNQLSSDFHLHLIGDWENCLHNLTQNNYTFYGFLNPEELLSVYRKAHVFIYCGYLDSEALDGFPTTAAADAMSTGCILLSTNPRNDETVLCADSAYMKVTKDEEITHFLYWIKENLESALQIGINGACQIKQHFDCEKNVRTKLSHIF